MDQGVRVVGSPGTLVHRGQQRPCQDAAGTCRKRTNQSAELLHHLQVSCFSPNPDPVGSSDQLWSSTPPPHRSISCCPRGCWEVRDTSPLQTHTAFSSAPVTHTHTVSFPLPSCRPSLAGQRCTGSVRLTVILQVIQAVARRLRGNPTPPPSSVADQQEAGLGDATCSSTNRTLPVNLHRYVCDGAPVLECDWWSVTPAA